MTATMATVNGVFTPAILGGPTRDVYWDAGLRAGVDGPAGGNLWGPQACGSTCPSM